MSKWGRVATELCLEEFNWAIQLRRLISQIDGSEVELRRILLEQATEEEKHGRMLQAIAAIEKENPLIGKTSKAISHWFAYDFSIHQCVPCSIEGTRKRRKTLQLILEKPIFDYPVDFQLGFVLLVEIAGKIFYSILSKISSPALRGVSKAIAADESDHIFALARLFFRRPNAIAILIFWVWRISKAMPCGMRELISILSEE